jgi:hypothetical protein
MTRLVLAILFALPSLEARAETPGEKAMRLMDEAMTRAKDQYFEYDVITQEPKKAQTKMSMTVRVKKLLRLIDFTAPGDIKGMRVLVLSLTQMYVYLPAYHKLRRVASHAREQGFMGTALSHDDTSISTYGDLYQGKLVGETKTHFRVQGTRRPGKDYPYARIDFAIRKDNHHPDELLYWSDKGVKLKTEARRDYSCQQNICTARVMKMTDHQRNSMWTELVRKEWRVNTGIADSEFTARALQRGH